MEIMTTSGVSTPVVCHLPKVKKPVRFWYPAPKVTEINRNGHKNANQIMKERVYHNKLIRDKIPEVIAASGDEFETRVMDMEEFERELRKKLVEEAKELSEATEDGLTDELADILELAKSIAEHHKINFEDVERYQADKRKKRGGFIKRLFLVWSTAQSGK